MVFIAERGGCAPSQGQDSPSGKHTKNYGKSPFFAGKSTINSNFQ